MTSKEQEAIRSLTRLLSEIRTENQKFREDVTNQIAEINKKTDKKHMPAMLELDILSTAQSAIGEAIRKIFVDNYNSPLKKLVIEVIGDYSGELKTLISTSFEQVIRTEDFKQSIIKAFSHKVARSIISNNDGLFDKVSNDLKQDAIFRSKMAIAVSNVVEECLRGKDDNDGKEGSMLPQTR